MLSSKTEPSQARRRLSWAISIVGFLVLLSGVFYMTGSTVGRRVHEFRERRTYNEVKRDAHAAFPLACGLGLGGLALMVLGSKLRSSKGREA